MKSSAVYSGFAGVALEPRAAPVDLRVAVFLLDLLDLGPHHLPAAVLVLEERADLPRALALLVELVADDQDLEPRQAVDLQLEDRRRSVRHRARTAS